MEAIIGLLFILAILAAVFVLPIYATLVARAARQRTLETELSLKDELGRLRGLVHTLQHRLHQLEPLKGPPASPLEPPPSPTPVAASVVASIPVAPSTEQTPAEAKRAVSAPPPLPAKTMSSAEARSPSATTEPERPLSPASAPVPPPILVTPPLPSPAPVTKSVTPAFTLEQFMGVKLFAWVGGLALFLGIAFFVKYAFEHNLVTPAARIAIGFALGTALTGGGFWLRKNPLYTVLAQTFCATGVLVLYGVTFAAHALYQFPAFNTLVTFGLMAAITASAFLLAVRMNAQVVAVLGMVGGFLTPLLLSTGEDRPVGLFGYITLLNIGLLAVARNRRWHHLTTLGAAGTILMQLGWVSKFLVPEGYLVGAKTWGVVAVFLWFPLLFTVGAWWSRHRRENNLHPVISALALGGSALLAGYVLLSHNEVATRPVVLYSLVLLVNVLIMAGSWIEPRARAAHALAGIVTFVHLTVWSSLHLSTDRLPVALGIYLLFGLLHTAFSVAWYRQHPGSSSQVAGYMPVVALLLMVLPVLRLDNVSFLIWPAILLANLLAITLALTNRSAGPVLGSLLLSLGTILLWLFRLPATPASLPGFLTVLCGFAAVFIAASCFLDRRLRSGQAEDISPLAQWLPVSSAVLPFLLLITASHHIPMPNPAPVFGAGLVLCLVLIGLARYSGVVTLVPAALGCILALQISWHLHRFSPAAAWQPLLWYVGVHGLFAVAPFVLRRSFIRTTLPWAAAAASGIGAFLLVHDVIKQTWPNPWMGLVPAAFALPPLAGFFLIRRDPEAVAPYRLSQLAWYGGAALFFLTIIFPVQFDRQWVTLGWAFEGAALCWLFRRVPHPGLRLVGTLLLLAAFARLALNPAVLSYYPRGSTPILNWHLYTYGLSAAACILASWWLAPPRNRIGGINLRALLCALGGILLFLLVNLEIADYFTPPGQKFIVFEFDGSFARDMTTSIAWGLFALGLLGLGFWLRTAATRYAGIGLLAITLLKLFFHDLSNIGSIYRIGALIIVALIALAASFLYQKFLDRSQPENLEK